MGEKPVKYIISQRNILFVENDKIYHNGKELEFEGDLQETVLNKKIEIYRNFFSRHFDNTIVLTGAGSSFGIGKTNVKGMTMRKLWEEIVKKCGKEPIENLGNKINFKIENIEEVNLEDFLSHASLFLLLYNNTDVEVERIVNKIKQIINLIVQL